MQAPHRTLTLTLSRSLNPSLPLPLPLLLPLTLTLPLALALSRCKHRTSLLAARTASFVRRLLQMTLLAPHGHALALLCAINRC